MSPKGIQCHVTECDRQCPTKSQRHAMRVHLRQGRTPNVNVNNWAKKVRGSQILQQKALQLSAGKVGQTSYTKILQDRFGIVKKFYKQQEGLTDKGMISPMKKSPIRTKTALERS